jgi:drug/metabolite transporter (DMT)-like permease
MMSASPSDAIARPTANLLPLSIAAFCLLWSTAFVAGKIGVTNCPPLVLLAARFSLAGILILGVSLGRRGMWTFSWRDVWVFALLGIVNNALYLGLAYMGLRTISAGLGGLIVSANPIFTAIFAALLLGERLTGRKLLGLALGIAGVTLIVAHRLSAGTDNATGVLLTVAALASIVTGTILFKRLAPQGNLWIGNGIQNLAAGLLLTPFALSVSAWGGIELSARFLAAFAFLVLGGSILAYALWFHLLTVCGATKASSFHFVMPPLSMLLAWVVLGEPLFPYDLLGIIPVAAGIYLVSSPMRKPTTIHAKC